MGREEGEGFGMGSTCICFCYEKHREKAAGPRKHQVWVKKITIGSQGRRMFPK